MKDPGFDTIRMVLTSGCLTDNSWPPPCSKCAAEALSELVRITAATGDFGAVPDPVSVPSGDSVTLIERLTAHAELDSTRQMGSMETCSLLREAADRIAVLGEAAILRAALAECEAVLYTLRRRAEIRNWDSTAMLSRKYVDGVISKAQNALQDSEAAVLELRKSDRQSSESRGSGTASAVSVEAGHCVNCGHSKELHHPWCHDPYIPGKCNYQYDLCSCREYREPEPASTTAALPPPESGSSGSGSASALEVEAGDGELLRELCVWVEEHLDALPDEEDENADLDDAVVASSLRHIVTGSLGCTDEGDYPPIRWRLLQRIQVLASAAKPEASPSPENELQDAELGAAIRPRAEAGEGDWRESDCVKAARLLIAEELSQHPGDAYSLLVDVLAERDFIGEWLQRMLDEAAGAESVHDAYDKGWSEAEAHFASTAAGEEWERAELWRSKANAMDSRLKLATAFVENAGPVVGNRAELLRILSGTSTPPTLEASSAGGVEVESPWKTLSRERWDEIYGAGYFDRLVAEGYRRDFHWLREAAKRYRLEVIPSDDHEYDLAHELDAAIAATSTRTALPSPSPSSSRPVSTDEEEGRHG